MLRYAGPSVPLQLPRDDVAVMALPRTPPPSWTLFDIMWEPCVRGRELLVRRAAEEGVLHFEDEPELVNVVAGGGSVSLLRYMVSERGVDPNQEDVRHITPLLATLSYSDTDLNALYLISEAGADVNAQWAGEGITPLMLAASCCRAEGGGNGGCGRGEQPAAAAAAAAAAAVAVGSPAATDPEEEEGLLEAATMSPPVVARPPPLEEYLEADAPEGLCCTISMALLDDLVLLVSDGITYSRATIEQHFPFCRDRGKPLSSPSTNMEITDPTAAILGPNVLVRGQVLEYKAAKEREWAEAERRWRDAAGEDQYG